MGCWPAHIVTVRIHWTHIYARNKCWQRTQPNGEFLDALLLSSVLKEGTLVFVMQSFSLDVY